VCHGHCPCPFSGSAEGTFSPACTMPQVRHLDDGAPTRARHWQSPWHTFPQPSRRCHPAGGGRTNRQPTTRAGRVKPACTKERRACSKLATRGIAAWRPPPQRRRGGVFGRAPSPLRESRLRPRFARNPRPARPCCRLTSEGRSGMIRGHLYKLHPRLGTPVRAGREGPARCARRALGGLGGRQGNRATATRPVGRSE